MTTELHLRAYLDKHGAPGSPPIQPVGGPPFHAERPGEFTIVECWSRVFVSAYPAPRNCTRWAPLRLSTDELAPLRDAKAALADFVEGRIVEAQHAWSDIDAIASAMGLGAWGGDACLNRIEWQALIEQRAGEMRATITEQATKMRRLIDEVRDLRSENEDLAQRPTCGCVLLSGEGCPCGCAVPEVVPMSPPER